MERKEMKLYKKISHKNIQILLEDLNFGIKIYRNVDITRQLTTTEATISSIVNNIKLRLNYTNDYLNFKKELIFISLDYNLKLLYKKYYNLAKEDDFYTIMEKIINKIYSPEGIKKSGNDVKDIVANIQSLKELTVDKETILNFIEYNYEDEIEDDPITDNAKSDIQNAVNDIFNIFSHKNMKNAKKFK